MQRTVNRVAVVVFDCDSTLTAVEGIDELAAEQRSAVEELTYAAMRGELPLEAVYGRRLGMIRPDRAQVDALGERYIEALVPDAVELMAALRAEGIEVRIMSGGLLPAVLAVAAVLGVPADAVAAVGITFDCDGGYAGFDAASPLARSGGKLDLLRTWRAGVSGRIMMVGDGATDLEAADAADVFVAYAGVAERAAVVAEADVVIRSTSLAPVLPLALGGQRPADAAAGVLFDRGVGLLEEQYRSLVQHSSG
ncbi:phosphoserine phosphatase [soil metagenome]